MLGIEHTYPYKDNCQIGKFPSTGRFYQMVNDTESKQSSMTQSMRASNNRSTWKLEEDLALLQLLLQNKDKLNHFTARSYPLRKFWESISIDLRNLQNIDRNVRQCKDRFNLLFSKGVRIKINGVKPRSERDKMIQKILKTFKLDHKGHITTTQSDNDNEDNSDYEKCNGSLTSENVDDQNTVNEEDNHDTDAPSETNTSQSTPMSDGNSQYLSIFDEQLKESDLSRLLRTASTLTNQVTHLSQCITRLSHVVNKFEQTIGTSTLRNDLPIPEFFPSEVYCEYPYTWGVKKEIGLSDQ